MHAGYIQQNHTYKFIRRPSFFYHTLNIKSAGQTIDGNGMANKTSSGNIFRNSNPTEPIQIKKEHTSQW